MPQQEIRKQVLPKEGGERVETSPDRPVRCNSRARKNHFAEGIAYHTTIRDTICVSLTFVVYQLPIVAKEFGWLYLTDAWSLVGKTDEFRAIFDLSLDGSNHAVLLFGAALRERFRRDALLDQKSERGENRANHRQVALGVTAQGHIMQGIFSSVPKSGGISPGLRAVRPRAQRSAAKLGRETCRPTRITRQ